MNDDELDRRLQAYGAQWRAEQEPPPEPMLRNRQVPRWIPVVAAAAAVVLIAVGVAVAVNQPHHASAPVQPGPTPSPDPTPSPAPTPSPIDLTGTVPWVDGPAPAYTRPSPRSDARPCTASDVATHPKPTEGAAGTIYYPIDFQNVSTSDCLLSGHPTAVATAPGRPDVTATDTTGQPGSTRNIAPGEHAGIVLVAHNLCTKYPGGAPSDPYMHFVIGLPGGGSKSFTGASLDLACGLGVSEFTVADQPAHVHDPLSDLKATLELPSAAVPGQPMWYVVDVNNPTTGTIGLERCPGYVETARAATTTNPLLKQTYALNCDTVTAIKAGQTIRYAMRADLPADTPDGPISISWLLDGPPFMQANGTVTVMANSASSP
jgi:hypothetical protein